MESRRIDLYAFIVNRFGLRKKCDHSGWGVISRSPSCDGHFVQCQHAVQQCSKGDRAVLNILS